MESIFENAAKVNPVITGWNTHKVESMASMFFNCSEAELEVGNDWHTSQVTSLNSTFWRAKAFNQDLSGWDTSKVTNSDDIFDGATAFDKRHQPVRHTAVYRHCSMFHSAVVCFDHLFS